MRTVRPKPLGNAIREGVSLTPEEGFVLSRIDGRLSLQDLVDLTGIEAGRVEQIVSKLVVTGAVEIDADEPRPPPPSRRAVPAPPRSETSLADFAAVLGMDPSAFHAEAPPAAPTDPDLPPSVEAKSDAPEPAISDAPPPLDELIEVPEDTPLTPLEEPPQEEAEAAVGEQESPERELQERNYRQMYEAKFRALTVDQRIAYSKTVHGADLYALCYDPDPKVIAGILENSGIALDHVRLIAMHHRNAVGIEILTRRNDWLRDAMVERRLLRNPQSNDQVLSRIFTPKRLLATYKVAVDREVPELTRVKGRAWVRKKWQQSQGEERADFILRTGARCLTIMAGCAFDAKTTQILTSRPINDVLMIQNFAKFGATPPGLLAHCAKQPFVRKNPALKKMLLAHPNMPGDVKRSF